MGGLFSGIGGFELAATRLGIDVRWMCEIDPYCQAVLHRHWPGVPVYADIQEVDWNAVEPVDILCGGPPCQPVSIAGERLGEADDRWLWPEVHRAIAALKPRWCCFENPLGLLTVGFDEATTPLEGQGYEVGVVSLPACAFGAPHKRERLWIIAHTDGEWEQQPQGVQRDIRRRSNDCAEEGAFAHADGSNRFGRNGALQMGRIRSPQDDARSGGAGSDEWGAQSRVRGVDDGVSAWVDGDWFGEFPEPLKLGVPFRTERVSALGNSIVPQAAEFVLRQILAASLALEAP